MRVHAAAMGAFGQAVAKRLCDLGLFAVTISGPDDALSPADVIVVATCRPIPDVFARADDVSFTHYIPWIAVVADGADVAIGPIVVPGRSTCYGCTQRRYAQHAGDADLIALRNEYYGADPQAGVPGFWPAVAGFAAATTADLITCLNKFTNAELRTVRRFNLLSWDITAIQITPVHGCTRCSLLRASVHAGLQRLAHRS